nr:RNase J family beta-CASP ribonuclease [Youxingia wuxianensis]
MTEEKGVGVRLTEQQLERGMERLEKRQAAPENSPPAKQRTKRTSSTGKGPAAPPEKQPGNSQKGRQTQNQSQQPRQVKQQKTQPSKAQPPKTQQKKAQAKTEEELVHQVSKSSRRKRGQTADKKRTPLRIIPLGGLNEVGKNLTVYEYGNDMFMVDCGMTFPDEQMLGVDLVIPDFTYILKNKDKLRGIVITHGHEDHIGALPFFLKNVNVPVYATKLTIGLIENKLREHGLYGKVKLTQITPKMTIKLGCMSVEFIRVNHSIPDAVAVAIQTPVGVVIQTGDFKIDYTPILGDIIDLARFGELGSKGVLALLSDSTNAGRPGFTPTERIVGDSFDKLFKQAEKRRIIIATFASNIHRIQQIFEAAHRYKRKVAVSGRSMVNVVAVAIELGYLKIPKGVFIDIDEINRYSPEQIVLITTGSQGEPMSALSRMSTGDHRKVTVDPNDFIIISATPIPGNEKTVSRVVNELMRLGADVIYEKMYEVHVSGHACQEELKIMLALTRPKFFFPVHGEYTHLKHHANLALSMGMDKKNVIIGEIGRVFELDGNTVKSDETVQSGRVLVDGLGVGDVGSIVLRDRQHLGQDGLIVVVCTIDQATGEIVAGPDIISRGFVYVREAEVMMNEARDIARQTIEDCTRNNVREWGNIKQQVRDALSSYFYNRTKRSPMLLPVIQEI